MRGKLEVLLECRDKKVLAQWKLTYHAFKNEEISSKHLKDPPFALHTLNLQQEAHCKRILNKFQYKYDVEHFYQNYKQVQNSLQALGDANSMVGVTPRTKQLTISTEIDMINDLRKSINDLKLCTC